MAISEQTQKDIAEHGRTIIHVNDQADLENNLDFSYTIGNVLADNPTPELLLSRTAKPLAGF